MPTPPGRSRKIRDKNEALALVAVDGMALKTCTKKLCNDIEVVVAALQSNGDAICYAAERIRRQKNPATMAVQNGSEIAFHAVSYFHDDLLVRSLAAQRCPGLAA